MLTEHCSDGPSARQEVTYCPAYWRNRQPWSKPMQEAHMLRAKVAIHLTAVGSPERVDRWHCNDLPVADRVDAARKG